MIYFLVPTGERGYMERRLLDGPARDLVSRLQVMTYPEASAAPTRPGTYVFAGVNHLRPAGRRYVGEIWQRLLRLGPDVRLLNHPLRTLGRYDMLRTLHASAMNAFAARRLPETGPPLRFPVFIRHTRRHTGALTRLLRNERELATASDMLQAFEDPAELLVIEFCDTSDDLGVFRKYGAFVIGNRVIPRYLFFSRGWMVKSWDLVDERKLQEERKFLETNPHEEWIREVFRMAAIEYGRIDYAILDGRPQAWEVNTNPGVWTRPSHERVDDQELVARRRVFAAFEELDAV